MKLIGKKQVKKIRITRQLLGDKEWVIVRFENANGECLAEWMPSFSALARIQQEIAKCEESKYPQEQGYKGWRFSRQFFVEASNPGVNIDSLLKRFKVPLRTGGIEVIVE